MVFALVCQYLILQGCGIRVVIVLVVVIHKKFCELV